MSGNLFIISAPSGTGKTTILKPIIKNTAKISFSVSNTTRAKRPNEVEGKDYFFQNEETFLETKAANGFLEWAQVHGNYYGTAEQAVVDQLKQDNDIILDIDVQGARQIRSKSKLNATFIFIVPPSWQELERRLTGRKTDTPETIKLRMDNAKLEMQDINLYDYVIVNDKLSDAVELLKAIIIEKRIKNRRDADGAPLSLPELT